MKSLGYALLFSGLVGGAIVLSNVISRQATQDCFRVCPANPSALKTVIDIGPLTLRLCNCGDAPSDRGEL